MLLLHRFEAQSYTNVFTHDTYLFIFISCPPFYKYRQFGSLPIFNLWFLSFIAGDIIFNARYPELPPDFIFGEDAEFLPEPSELPVSIFNRAITLFPVIHKTQCLLLSIAYLEELHLYKTSEQLFLYFLSACT